MSTYYPIDARICSNMIKGHLYYTYINPDGIKKKKCPQYP